jgi:UrcA family protein
MIKTVLNIASLAVLAAIVVLGALLSAPSAHAAVSGETLTYTISTTGLDLRTSRGARAMLWRIETAAETACGAAPISADLNMTYHWRACVSRNISEAVSLLGSPMVAEIAHQPSTAQTASR